MRPVRVCEPQRRAGSRVNHALLLGLGGFRVGQTAAGPGVEEGPVSIDFSATPATTSSDWQANVGWETFTIDPALLH